MQVPFLRKLDDLERVYLVGVTTRQDKKDMASGAYYGIQESLEELGRLADTAGLQVGCIPATCCLNAWIGFYEHRYIAGVLRHEPATLVARSFADASGVACGPSRKLECS